MLLKRAQEIERFLRSPDPALRAALIHGRDASLVRERADALARRVTERPDDPFDVALIDEAALAGGGERLFGELQALSMMGGRRLVRLRLADASSTAEAIAAEALTGHLAGAFNPDSFLLIEAGDLRGASLLVRAAAVECCALLVCYQDEPADVTALLREALSREGLSLTSDAQERFVSRMPPERLLVRQEVERLVLYLGNRRTTPATESDLDDFVGVEPEVSLAGAAIDAFGGRIAAALRGVRRAEQAGERGPAAVRALGFHLSRLRRALALEAGGASAQQAVKSAGVFWKQEREFIRQMRAWTYPELDRTQADILVADESCKRTLAPDSLIAERLALSVAGRAHRLGL